MSNTVPGCPLTFMHTLWAQQRTNRDREKERNVDVYEHDEMLLLWTVYITHASILGNRMITTECWAGDYLCERWNISHDVQMVTVMSGNHELAIPKKTAWKNNKDERRLLLYYSLERVVISPVVNTSQCDMSWIAIDFTVMAKHLTINQWSEHHGQWDFMKCH